MLSLEQAARIYSNVQNIVEFGKSPFLTNAIIHKSGKICELIENINSSSILFSTSYINAESFISSLKVDDVEVIGCEVKYRKYTNIYTDISSKFYVNTDKICEMANPAFFGKGSETVYDENVRKAFDITADRITLNTKEDLNYFFDLNIPKNKKLDFKLYKMHIYKEGGKFTRHKDTIHSPNHYATLIISVPTEFKGGELVLYKNTGDETPLKKCSLKNYYDNSIIFLTDVEHEVLEVTSGTRIVLQYDVYLIDNDIKEEKNNEKEDYDKKDHESNDEEDEEDDDETECPYNKDFKTYFTLEKYVEELNKDIDNQLLNEIENFTYKNPKSEICFLLSREYPLAISVDCLKAGDKKLYDILTKKYEVDIGYVVNCFESDYEGCYDYRRKELKVMNYTDIQDFKNMNFKEKIFKNVTHLFVTSGRFISTKSVDYIEHTGNEAAPAEFTYVSIVLSCKIN